MTFFVFNDIKIKVWKFENKPRAYFRGGGLFSGLFSCSDLGGLFSGRAYFRGGSFSEGLIFGMKFALEKGVGLLSRSIFLQQ